MSTINDQVSAFRCRVKDERSSEIFEERVLCVFFGEEGFGWIYLPVDGEGFVLDGDAAVGFGVIVVIAFVLEYGDVTEDGEAVGKASRNEELAMVVFGQFYCYVLAVGRRAFADVDGYVEDCAFDATDELGLGIWWTLEVEAAHDAVGGAGFVVLDEVYFGYLLVEDLLVVAFEEVAAGVFEDFGFYYKNTIYFCWDYLHMLMFFITQRVLLTMNDKRLTIMVASVGGRGRVFF